MFRSLIATTALAALLAATPGQTQEAPRFYFGADLSYVNEMEACGASYRLNGQVRDPYEIFAETGHNLVRVRLWHDAEWTDWSDLPDVKATIRRARAAGMQVLLDFHYSDEWADGDKQIVPKAWRHLRDDIPALSQAVHDYTRAVLAELDAEGLMPEMVQVGNETNLEVMGELDWKQTRGGIDWARDAALLNAGIRAVREAGAASSINPRIMLHIAQPENVEPWFAAAAEAGLTDFDLIGISYYRKWSSEDLAGLEATLRRLDAAYAAEVIVVETSYPFTTDSADPAHNLLGEDTLLPEYPATEEGQLRYMTDITQLVIDAGGVGVVYWEPAWVSTRCSTRWGQGSHWENATFFDWRRGNDLTAAGRWAEVEYRWPQTPRD
jgi:arabinogalactan endo-1,4-beta-galactosidase